MRITPPLPQIALLLACYQRFIPNIPDLFALKNKIMKKRCKKHENKRSCDLHSVNKYTIYARIVLTSYGVHLAKTFYYLLGFLLWGLGWNPCDTCPCPINPYRTGTGAD